MKCFRHVRKLEWGKPLKSDNVIVVSFRGLLLQEEHLRNLEVTTSLRSETDPFLHILVTNQQRDSEKEIIDRVEALAKKKGVSMAIIATAWLLSKDGTSPRTLL